VIFDRPPSQRTGYATCEDLWRMLFADLTHDIFLKLSFEIGWCPANGSSLTWSRADLLGMTVDELISYAVMAQDRRKLEAEHIRKARDETNSKRRR
jgi:hypothetical protein